MLSIFRSFWNGKLALWKSYWLVGELLNALVLLVIFNAEIYYFGNNKFLEYLPLLSYSELTFFSKIAILIWSIFITIGIWRSAENYKGNIIWVILSLIVLSYRLFTLRLVLY